MKRTIIFTLFEIGVVVGEGFRLWYIVDEIIYVYIMGRTFLFVVFVSRVEVFQTSPFSSNQVHKFIILKNRSFSNDLKRAFLYKFLLFHSDNIGAWTLLMTSLNHG